MAMGGSRDAVRAAHGVRVRGVAHLYHVHILNPAASDVFADPMFTHFVGVRVVTSSAPPVQILERKAPPTFPIVVEIRARNFYVAHWVEDSVDQLLLGRMPVVQVRGQSDWRGLRLGGLRLGRADGACLRGRGWPVCGLLQ